MILCIYIGGEQKMPALEEYGIEKRETQQEMNARLAKEAQDSIDEIAISDLDLSYESSLKQTYNVRHNIETSTYNKNDIRQQNTYNALRLIYRVKYDAYSTGHTDPVTGKIVGKEIDPTTGKEMPVNYLNDFSLSPKFDPYFFCKFDESICKYAPMGYFPFNPNNGVYKSNYEERLNYFIEREPYKKKYMSSNMYNFFGLGTQVNPLLYAYGFQDPETGEYVTMDSDAHLDRFSYTNVFNNETYIMKGNQHNIKLWAHVINTKCNHKPVYVENEEGDEEVYGYEEIYENQEYLFKDEYTRKFLTILQNPKRYFKFVKQSNYEMSDQDLIDRDIYRRTIYDIRKQGQTRGYLFYDVLMESVYTLMEHHIKSDKTAPIDANDKIRALAKFYRDPKSNHVFEFDGFPIDVYLALHGYNMYHSAKEEEFNKFASEELGDYMLNLYRHYYNVVFSQTFSVLPYILSPGYKFSLQSPAMNIMLTAFTIMAAAIAREDNYADYHNRFFMKLVNIANKIGKGDINAINTFNLYDQFDVLDEEGFVSDYVAKPLEKILPILMTSTANANYDVNKINSKEMLETDVETYATEKMYAYVENQPVTDENRSECMSKALILLTEFFHKMEGLRYFDAATFHIDYTVTRDKDTVRYLRIFANSLQEACYIHMNTLGSEIFFNSKAPTHNSIVFSKSILRNEHREPLLGMDDARILKNNTNLFNEMNVTEPESDLQKHNSYHSYMSMINLYTSLVYCIYITIDNVKVNLYCDGPYSQRNLKRPQSLWTILKRYALHMTYMNNNGFGIYNEKTYSNYENAETKRMMVSQRVKWLTYGLHLKVWFSDGYFFYSNYPKLMMNHKHDINSAMIDMMALYKDHVNGITRNLTLFEELLGEKISGLILPNIGLAVAPTAGSYTIQAALACFNRYLCKLPYIDDIKVNMIHHAMKDIMVGDSMSSIVGARMDCVRHMLNDSVYKNTSFNNTNYRFQNIYNEIGSTAYYEMAMGANLERLYKEVIRPYYMENGQEALMLNSSSVNACYDKDFFANYNESCAPKIAYTGTWCKQALKWLLNNYNDKQLIRSLMCRITNLYRLAVENYKTYTNKDKNTATLIESGYESHFGYGISNANLIDKYTDGMRKYYRNADEYGFFNIVLDNLTYGSGNPCKPRLDHVMNNTAARTCFEDNIVRYSASGCIYGMYEDPMMLMAYNSIDFNIGLLKPMLQTLYLFGKDILYRSYGATKRMIVDLNYGGEPFKRIMEDQNCDLDSAKRLYMLECIEHSYMRINRDKSLEEDDEFFGLLKNNKDLYDYSTTVAQFMDYDYIAGRMCTLFNNPDNITNLEEGIKFLNNSINSRSQEYNRHCYYTRNIDASKNLLNNIIDTMIKKKRGSIMPYKSVKLKEATVPEDNKDKEIINKDIDLRKEGLIHSDTRFPRTIEDTDNLIVDMQNNLRLVNAIVVNTIGITDDEYKQLLEDDVKDYEKENKAKNESTVIENIPPNNMLLDAMVQSGVVKPNTSTSQNQTPTTTTNIPTDPASTSIVSDVTESSAPISSPDMKTSVPIEETKSNNNNTSTAAHTTNSMGVNGLMESEVKQYIDSVGYEVASILTMRKMIDAVLDLKSIMVNNLDISTSIDKNVKQLLDMSKVMEVTKVNDITTTIANDKTFNVPVESTESIINNDHVDTTTNTTIITNTSIGTVAVNENDESAINVDNVSSPIDTKEESPILQPIEEKIHVAEPMKDNNSIIDPNLGFVNNGDYTAISNDPIEIANNNNDTTTSIDNNIQAATMMNQQDAPSPVSTISIPSPEPTVSTTNTTNTVTMLDIPRYTSIQTYDPMMYCPATKLDRTLTYNSPIDPIVKRILETIDTREQNNVVIMGKYPAHSGIESFLDFEIMDYCRISIEDYVSLNDLQRYQLRSVYMNLWVDFNKVRIIQMALARNMFISEFDINDPIIYEIKWYLQIYIYQHPNTINLKDYENEALRIIRDYNLDGSNPNADLSVQSKSMTTSINDVLMGGSNNSNGSVSVDQSNSASNNMIPQVEPLEAQQYQQQISQMQSQPIPQVSLQLQHQMTPQQQIGQQQIAQQQFQPIQQIPQQQQMMHQQQIGQQQISQMQSQPTPQVSLQKQIAQQQIQYQTQQQSQLTPQILHQQMIQQPIQQVPQQQQIQQHQFQQQQGQGFASLDYNNLSNVDKANLEQTSYFHMVNADNSLDKHVIPTLPQKLDDKNGTPIPDILKLTVNNTMQEVVMAINSIPYEAGKQHMFNILRSTYNYDTDLGCRTNVINMLRYMYNSLVLSNGMYTSQNHAPQFDTLVKSGEMKTQGLT